MHLWYSPGRYAKLVVLKLKIKLVGWPAHVPYEDISKIKGGNEVLETLLNLWKSRALRFEPATECDLRYAKVDPVRVHPNPSALCKARGERRGGGASGGADGDDSGCEGDVEANGIGGASELDIDVNIECAPSLPVRSGQCSVSDARLAAAETQALVQRPRRGAKARRGGQPVSILLIPHPTSNPTLTHVSWLQKPYDRHSERWECLLKGCTATFADKRGQERHMDSHMNTLHGKRYECPWCGALYSRIDTARRHVRKGCAEPHPGAQPNCLAPTPHWQKPEHRQLLSRDAE